MIKRASRNHAFLACCIALLSVLGCGWEYDNPSDPQNCDPSCSEGQSCYMGECLVCNNGKVEGMEECDGASLNNKHCKDFESASGKAYVGGTLTCIDCLFDTSQCNFCGDGIKTGDEECDGSVPAGVTCNSLGFDKGTLTCDDVTCKLVKKCTKVSCGDGDIDKGEDCDGTLLGGQSCKTQGFHDGTLACYSKNSGTPCKLNTEGCHNCGNNTVESNEDCEWDKHGKHDLNKKMCSDYKDSDSSQTVFEGGELGCTKNCVADTSKCTWCGDSKKLAKEECDLLDFGGQTCASFSNSSGKKFDGGTLTCTAKTCKIDTTNCTRCGDGKKEGAEECEGKVPTTAKCSDYTDKSGKNYTAGTLSCSSTTCKIDTTKCTWCGDGKMLANEECDKNDFGGKVCKDFKDAKGINFDGGTLKCDAKTCKLNKKMCARCGDGIQAVSEKCDGTVPKTSKCSDHKDKSGTAFTDGILGCLPKTCDFDTSKCTWCGDGKKLAKEECDTNALGGKTCASFKDKNNKLFTDGTLACSPITCKFDTTKCTWCGDGKKLGKEECDTADFGAKTCASFKDKDNKPFTTGKLKCSPKCLIDTSNCKV